MAITIEQREQRRTRLGASDVAAILGLDPFRTAHDLYLEKTGKLVEAVETEAMTRGNLLEDAILNWCEREIAAPILRNVPTCVSPGGILAANLDGDCPALGAIIEAKSSSNVDEYGDSGTDAVPMRTIVQTHIGMYCSGRRVAYVPLLAAMFGRFDWRLYIVDYRADVAEAIVARAESFWRDHVLADVPPTGSVGSIDVLKRVRREPATWATVPNALVLEWIDAKDEASRAEKRQKAAQAAILTAMGTAEGARTESGESLTYLETARKGFTVEATTYRTLRMVGAKKSKEFTTKGW